MLVTLSPTLTPPKGLLPSIQISDPGLRHTDVGRGAQPQACVGYRVPGVSTLTLNSQAVNSADFPPLAMPFASPMSSQQKKHPDLGLAIQQLIYALAVELAEQMASGRLCTDFNGVCMLSSILLSSRHCADSTFFVAQRHNIGRATCHFDGEHVDEHPHWS